jgi:hypothetical protein
MSYQLTPNECLRNLTLAFEHHTVVEIHRDISKSMNLTIDFNGIMCINKLDLELNVVHTEYFYNMKSLNMALREN